MGGQAEGNLSGLSVHFAGNVGEESGRRPPTTDGITPDGEGSRSCAHLVPPSLEIEACPSDRLGDPCHSLDKVAHLFGNNGMAGKLLDRGAQFIDS
jgi:hypothetical protein